MSRKKFSSEFKSKVAIEALKGHKTINELGSEFGVHPTQVNNWKQQLIEASRSAFNGKQQGKTLLKRNQSESSCMRRLVSSRWSWTGLKKRQDT